MTIRDFDDDCKKILYLMSISPKTPAQISKLTDIPITRCWEKIRYLESLGLIRNIITFVGKNGRTLKYYETLELPEQSEELDIENYIEVPYLG